MFWLSMFLNEIWVNNLTLRRGFRSQPRRDSAIVRFSGTFGPQADKSHDQMQPSQRGYDRT